MTRAERAEAIREIVEKLGDAENMVIDAMHTLEELKCKRTAKKLDTVCGKLYNIGYELHDKTKHV